MALCLVTTPLIAASAMFFIWLFVAGMGIIIGRMLRMRQRYHQQKKLEEQRHKLMAEAMLLSTTILGKRFSFAKIGIPVLGFIAYFLWKKNDKDIRP